MKQIILGFLSGFFLVVIISFCSHAKAATLNFINTSDAYPIYVDYAIATITYPEISWGSLTRTPEIANGTTYKLDIDLAYNQKLYIQSVQVTQPTITWLYQYCDNDYSHCMTPCAMDNNSVSLSFFPVYHYKNYPLPPDRVVECNIK